MQLQPRFLLRPLAVAPEMEDACLTSSETRANWLCRQAARFAILTGMDAGTIPTGMLVWRKETRT